MGTSALLSLAVLLACGDNIVPLTTLDAAPSPTAFTFHLYLFPAEPTDRPPPPTAPTAYIDGVAARGLALRFPTESSALGTSHRVELRYGDLVVASRDVSITLASCLGRVPDATDDQETVCVYDSGDLRYGGDEAIGPNHGCIADSPCFPVCEPNGDTCPAAQRCTSRIMSTNPIASHLGCAPVGTMQLGDACTLIADPLGAYDDCTAGLLCVGGTCHLTCSHNDPAACTGCEYVPGHAPELAVCP